MSSRAATAGAALRGRSEGGVTPWEGSDSSGDEEATAKTSPRSPRTEAGGGSNHSPRDRHTADSGKGGTWSNRRPPVRSALRAGRETGADDDGEKGAKSSQQGGHMQPQEAPKTAPTPRIHSRRAASGVSFAAEVSGEGPRGRGEEWDGRQEPEERSLRIYDVEPVRWIRGDGGKGVRWGGEWASPAGNEGRAGIRQARDVRDEGDVRGKVGGGVGHANSYLASTGAYGGGGGLGGGAKRLVHGGPDNFDWSGLENAGGGGRLVIEMDVMPAGGGLGAMEHGGDQQAKGREQDQGQGQAPGTDSGIAGGVKAVMDRDGEIVVELEGGGHEVGAESGMGEMWDVRGRRKSSPRKSISPHKGRTTSSPSKGRASISPSKDRNTSSPPKGHNNDQMSPTLRSRKTSGFDLPELAPLFSRSILDDGGKVGLLFDQQAAAAAAQGLSSWYDAGVRLDLAPKVPSLPLGRVPSYSLTLPAEGLGGEREREREREKEGGGAGEGVEGREGRGMSRGIMSGIATSRGRLETAKSAKSVEIELGEEYRAGTAATGREGRELERWGGVRGGKGERIAMRPRTVRTATARRNARGAGDGFGAAGSMHHSKSLDSFEAGASANRRSKTVGAMSNDGRVRLPKTAREQHEAAACRSPKARELTRLLWSTSDDVQSRLNALEWGRDALEAQDLQISKTVDQPLCLVPYAGAKLFR